MAEFRATWPPGSYPQDLSGPQITLRLYLTTNIRIDQRLALDPPLAFDWIDEEWQFAATMRVHLDGALCTKL